MKREHLIPIAIGLGILILVVVAGALFFSGNNDMAGATAAAAAAGAAAVANQRRKQSSEELTELSEEAEAGIVVADELRDEADKEFAKIDTDVKEKSLSDLVDEENG
jgi:hypothetical protein